MPPRSKFPHEDVACSYATRTGGACRAIVTWVCSACKRVACGHHVERGADAAVCCACRHDVRRISSKLRTTTYLYEDAEYTVR